MLTVSHLMPCPAASDLKAFAIGDLPTGALLRVEHHVEDCAQCQAALEEFDCHRDGLVTDLVQTAAASPWSAVPEPVLASARAAVFAADHAPQPDLSIDSGRHFVRLLEQGSCRLGRFELLAELARDRSVMYFAPATWSWIGT